MNPSHSSTSLKLDEAKYFHKMMMGDFEKSKKSYVYHLNAFLNAARNITFVMQKEFRSKEGFNTWYEGFRERIPAVYKDFIELRNISVKEKSIEPFLLSGQVNLFPKGLKIPAKSSAEVAFSPNPTTRKVEITVTHSDGRVEHATRPLMMDFLINEEGDKAGQAIVIDDFMRVSKDYLRHLGEAVKECENRFVDLVEAKNLSDATHVLVVY